ncbi:MAG: transketolase, partial [Synergistaceae bacterium]|nr:transketolase [Synergistaceae bacterium]
MSASKYKLNNIIAIIDKNNIQYDGYTEIIMPLNSLKEKWQSFGWNVMEIDGHNVLECRKAFSSRPEIPLCVIANTIKGKGISFMEGEPGWHHAKMTKTQREQAWGELAND